MRRKILPVLLWLCAILILLTGIAAAVLYVNKDKIINQIVLRANQYLAAPVKVAAMDVSLRTFPMASIEFREIFCPGAEALPGDTLIYSERMYLEFDLWEVLSENISIKRISFEQGRLHLAIPARGTPNYQIWKEDSTKSSDSFLQLEEVSLAHFKTSLWEEQSATYFSALSDDLNFGGSFSNDNYQLQCNWQFKLDSITVANQTYLTAEAIRSSFDLEGSGSKGKISGGKIDIDGLRSDFELLFDSSGVEINAFASQLELSKAFALSQRQGWYSNPGLKLDGQGQLTVNALFPSDQPPSVTAGLSTESSQIKGSDNAQLENIKADISYRYNGKRSDLRLSSFEASGQTGKLHGNLSLINLSAPLVEGKLQSDLDLSEWLIFFPTDTISEVSGKVILDVYFKNKFASLDNIAPADLKSATTRGSLQLENAGFSFKNASQRIEDINSTLSFSNNDLQIEQFSLKIDSSDIYLSGRFINAINYAFFNDQRLLVNASLHSDNLQLEDFLSISKPSSNSEEKEYSLAIASSLTLDLSLEVDHFQFEKFRASNIRGQLMVENGNIRGRNIALEADEGSYAGEFKINTYLVPHVVQASLKARNINLNQVFISFKNFGQDAILAENIYGKAHIDLDLKALMDPRLNIDPASLQVNASININQGRLRNYEPMLALSDFAAIDELRDVRFASLQNDIRIKNSTIFVPRMEIESNVMDLGLQGTHNFDNVVDYSIRLKMTDVMFNGRKKKSRNSEFEDHLAVKESEDDPNIYIKLRGPAADPDISLDKREIGKSINRDLARQGKEIKEVFSRDDRSGSDNKDAGIQYDLFGDEGEK